MTPEEYISLLAAHGIRPTANRLLVARALGAQANPMSLKELGDKILTIDKSGIFRALTLFRQHHLVHDIEDGAGDVKYELCLSHDDDQDDDQHVHFYCERCHRTFCLTDIPVPLVPLPLGYRRTSVNYVVRGLCPNCR